MRGKGDDAAMDEASERMQETARLAAEYAGAHYFVSIGHREWLFGVGQCAADIERELGGSRYLFITAWNPASDTTPVEANLAADERLQARLKASGCEYHSALGSNAQGGAVEYGWVAVDVAEETGDAWAREFGQAGTLCWRRGEAVRLRMLRPAPADADDGAHTDWVG